MGIEMFYNSLTRRCVLTAPVVDSLWPNSSVGTVVSSPEVRRLPAAVSVSPRSVLMAARLARAGILLHQGGDRLPRLHVGHDGVRKRLWQSECVFQL